MDVPRYFLLCVILFVKVAVSQSNEYGYKSCKADIFRSTLHDRFLVESNARPKISYNSKEDTYLVVYEVLEETGKRYDIRGRLFDADISEISGEFRIASSTQFPERYPFVHYNDVDNSFLCTYELHKNGTVEMRGVIISGDAAQVSEPTLFIETGEQQERQGSIVHIQRENHWVLAFRVFKEECQGTNCTRSGFLLAVYDSHLSLLSASTNFYFPNKSLPYEFVAPQISYSPLDKKFLVVTEIEAVFSFDFKTVGFAIFLFDENLSIIGAPLYSNSEDTSYYSPQIAYNWKENIFGVAFEKYSLTTGAKTGLLIFDPSTEKPEPTILEGLGSRSTIEYSSNSNEFVLVWHTWYDVFQDWIFGIALSYRNAQWTRGKQFQVAQHSNREAHPSLAINSKDASAVIMSYNETEVSLFKMCYAIIETSTTTVMSDTSATEILTTSFTSVPDTTQTGSGNQNDDDGDDGPDRFEDDSVKPWLIVLIVVLGCIACLFLLGLLLILKKTTSSWIRMESLEQD